MNSILKALIAIACVVVLAAAGVYLWDRSSEALAAREAQARLEGAREELFGLAKAKSHEIEKVRKFCERTDARLETDLAENEIAHQIVRNCRYFRYL